MAARFRLCVALLAVMAALTFLPGLAGVGPIDRDEPRYTQASKQMVERGDYVDIRLQEQPRYKKPIGIYWLQALFVEVSGYGADAPLWVYRLVSVLSAALAVAGTCWAARAFLGPQAALVAGGLLAVTIIVGFEARIAKTDAALLATIVLAQAALARLWLMEARPRFFGLPFVFWLAVSASILVKGPIVLLVTGGTIAALLFVGPERRAFLTRLTPLRGLAMTVLLVAPWFVAIWLASDGAFYQEAILNDFLGKAATGQEGHWAPPLAHMFVSVGTAWPLMALLLISLPSLWVLRREKLVVFCAAWVLPAWIVFEAVPTKLPHYTLPLVPALALAVSAVLVEWRRELGPRWLRILAAVELAAIPVLLMLASVGLPLVLGDPISWVGVILSIAGAALGVRAALLLAADRSRLTMIGSVAAASVLLGVAAWGNVLPKLQSVWLSGRVAAAAKAAADCPDPTLITVGNHEPSLVFLAGTETRLEHHGGAIHAISQVACPVLAVDESHVDEVLADADAAGIVLERRGSERGVNIGNGRSLNMVIYTTKQR
ncbi:ArnT family glycosyltransferase [Amorphus orientalis]|uniref:4-amino-4-deoxy-L-arabinose transferase-like glycosyltransferase n=1 Tax=Amorphus orientalis TaxID=649198 RepID=A0AAE3VQK3_9HYPH|nr:glycosyltransferase family 39 protein [Amorphus orientalis]MDQ0316343.1 4-amino-4-deoxy-L-arabinose transferase-like glycosyltransferase [Amorphus orientalis]